MIQKFKAAGPLSGEVRVPGDKSISHRALMIAALAEGTSRIQGLSPGLDVTSTAACMRELGASFEPGQAHELIVRGTGKHGLKAPETELYAGNSGTTIRLLSGILAGQRFTSRISGDQYLVRRPMKRVIEPLEMMGAGIESGPGGHPPLTIHGGDLEGITYYLPVPSAQVKSCVLLAGLFAGGVTRVVESVPSRDHTERMLPLFGAPVRVDGLESSVEGGARLSACDLIVPGDPSSAAFFAAAAALVPGSRVSLPNLTLNPTRAAFFEVLRRMGARVERLNERNSAGEPVADLEVSFSSLKSATVEGAEVPSLIDEIPVLAVVATQAHGVTRIRDAGELRVKETDRIKAIAGNLRSMGAAVEEHADGLDIEGPTPLAGCALDSFGDHRIAMAFSIAGLVASGETVITDAGCADISFPGFYSLLRGLHREK